MLRAYLTIPFVFLCVCIGACAPKPRQVLEQVDFANPAPPDFVSEITGISGQETWGRWTDASIAPAAKIRFREELPKEFALIIKGQTMPEHEVGIVRVGTFEQEFYLHGVGDTATVHVDNSAGADTVEIIAKKPASPKDLGLNDDARKLGIGLMSITIEKYEN